MVIAIKISRGEGRSAKSSLGSISDVDVLVSAQNGEQSTGLLKCKL